MKMKVFNLRILINDKCGLVLLLVIIFLSTKAIVDGEFICPKAFVHLGRKCYYFSKAKATFQDSHYECRNLNSSLALITKASQQNKLKKYLAKKPNAGEKWLGGMYNWKRNEWIWASNGNQIKYNAFSGTAPNRPWHCLVIDPALQNKWSSRSCFKKKQFICQKNATVLIDFKVTSRKDFNISKCGDLHLLPNYEKERCLSFLGPVNYNVNGANEPASLKRKPHKLKSFEPFDISYICPKKMFSLGNMCYSFSKEKANFIDAFLNCNHQLAIIRNRKQDRVLRIFLNNKFVENEERWIGGMYDWKLNLWKWASKGRPLKYKGFAKNILQHKDLSWTGIILDPKLHNQWNVRLLSDQKHYICEEKPKNVLSYHSTPPPSALITILN